MLCVLFHKFGIVPSELKVVFFVAVASNATVDPLGDSGEESEDEWNYVPGKDPKPSTTEVYLNTSFLRQIMSITVIL